jgi:hypothetical protein
VLADLILGARSELLDGGRHGCISRYGARRMCDT